MYTDREMYLRYRFLIPTEILLNDKIKQLLPTYLTLCILADQTEEEVTRRKFTIRELCCALGTLNVTKLRQGQYIALEEATDWLEKAGYVTFDGLNWEDTKCEFTFKMADSIFALLQTREKEYQRNFTPVFADELFSVRRAIRESDNDNKVRLSVLRTYFYLRSLCGVWQTTFKEKLPAWCGYFNYVYKQLHMIDRTFSRTIDVMKNIGLITVTHVKYDTQKSGKAPGTIVIFNLLCGNEDVREQTLLVEKRIDEIYGTNCSWYIPGSTLKTHGAPELTDVLVKKPDDISVQDAAQDKESEEQCSPTEEVVTDEDLQPYIDRAIQNNGLIEEKDLDFLYAHNLLNRVKEIVIPRLGPVQDENDSFYEDIEPWVMDESKIF